MKNENNRHIFRTMRMTHGSLFSGIGGFDLAAQWCGWENAFWCETNPFCRRILGYYFNKSKGYGDIKETDFREWRGGVDVLTAGFPCQPFSTAGRRGGSADDRYLWPEVIRVIREVRPTWFVGENVAGITSMVQPGSEVEVESSKTLFGEDCRETVLRQQYVVETICDDLEQAGYTIVPVIIPACSVGAPHRRDRVFFMAQRADAGIEGVQRGRKNGVYELRAVAHTDGKLLERRLCKKQEYELESFYLSKMEQFKASGNAGFEGENVAHADGFDGDLSGFCAGAVLQHETSGIRGNIAPDAAGGRRRQNDESKPAGQPEQDIPDWRSFPTQSPVCWRDDGLSDRLAGITFPAWRRQSIEAFGNAIVPQVVYETFSIINKTV